MKINYLIEKYYTKKDHPKIIYVISEPDDPELLIVQKEHPKLSIQSTIKYTIKCDVLIISLIGLDGKDLAVALNNLSQKVGLFIAKVDKYFDFNSFVRSSEYNHVDIYHIRRVDYYYLVITERK